MKKVGIATDSHSGILPELAGELGVMVLPMPFYVEEECFYEGVSITREQFFSYLQEGIYFATVSGSCDGVLERGFKEV